MRNTVLEETVIPTAQSCKTADESSAEIEVFGNVCTSIVDVNTCCTSTKRTSISYLPIVSIWARNKRRQNTWPRKKRRQIHVRQQESSAILSMDSSQNFVSRKDASLVLMSTPVRCKP